MAVAGGARLRQNLKGKLSTTLKSWLPILQSDLFEVEDILKDYAKENPFLSLQSPLSKDFSSTFRSLPKNNLPKAGITDKIEQLTIAEESLYEHLYRQIAPPLFPTELSRVIAFDIVEGISADGYFQDDSAQAAARLGVSEEEYERVRKRFCFLEPRGVGARDVIESFFFQLESSEVDNETYALCQQIIAELDTHHTYRHQPRYNDAMHTIRSFKNPPALDFAHEDAYKIPDIFIHEEDGNISVRTNDECYPIIELDRSAIEQKRLESEFASRADSSDAQSYIKHKVKEAKDLIDALEMRKATIKKVGLMIVDYQYEFFTGGEMKPMKLKDIAEELGYAPSTISRAISNKYLECERGVFAIKSFFTTAIDGDVSNASIKDFLLEIIKNENRKKPLSDIKILSMIEERFGLKIVRRTITKYRQQLNIASSSERKKLYEMSV